MLCARVANVLRSHSGSCTVRVKCPETKNIITLEDKVDINDVLLTELKGLLKKDAIFIKEKNGEDK
jgi:phage FluMu protein Com